MAPDNNSRLYLGLLTQRVFRSSWRGCELRWRQPRSSGSSSSRLDRRRSVYLACSVVSRCQSQLPTSHSLPPSWPWSPTIRSLTGRSLLRESPSRSEPIASDPSAHYHVSRSTEN